MRRAALLLMTVLVAACGDERSGQESREPVQTADLTGLYEGQGQGTQKNRLCMLSASSGNASFGIVSFTNAGACSGSGEAALQGEVLRLAMAGAEQCEIEARASNGQVTLPASVPEGCAYYCSPGATLAGAEFEKTGGTAEDAARAVDLAGDPLCG